MYLILAILLAGLGLLMLLRPDAFYEITEGWKSSSCGEPSDLYILSARIGGGFMLAVGLIGVAVEIFL